MCCPLLVAQDEHRIDAGRAHGRNRARHSTRERPASSPATSANVSGSAGDFMRHPKGGPHYDGALNEDTWVAISGYGPANATVIDGGELFGRSR